MLKKLNKRFLMSECGDIWLQLGFGLRASPTFQERKELRYPENKSKHAEIVGQYFTKLFKTGALYKRLTRSKVRFLGKVHHWELQYLAEQHGGLSCEINVRKMGRGAQGSTSKTHPRIRTTGRSIPWPRGRFLEPATASSRFIQLAWKSTRYPS